MVQVIERDGKKGQSSRVWSEVDKVIKDRKGRTDGPRIG